MKLAMIAAPIVVMVVPSASSAAISSQVNSSSAQTAWVADSLRKMEAIKPGMTRADLLRVFTTEGGLFSRTARTYVSRDCPLFKVDVRFQSVGNGGPTENSADVIASISRPYLQMPVLD